MCWMCEEDALYRAYLERAEAAKPRSGASFVAEAADATAPQQPESRPSRARARDTGSRE